VNEERERLQRCVRMSRVTAAREKRSAWVGFVWVECHVWREGLEGVDAGLDWGSGG
jgi:hypothetical protein